MVQWLRLFVFTTEVLCSIPGQGTKILASHLAGLPQKNIYQKKKKKKQLSRLAMGHSLPNLVFELVNKTLAAYSY